MNLWHLAPSSALDGMGGLPRWVVASGVELALPQGLVAELSHAYLASAQGGATHSANASLDVPLPAKGWFAEIAYFLYRSTGGDRQGVVLLGVSLDSGP